MARIKITKAAEQNTIRVSNTSQSAEVPIDGQFHDIHDDLLPVLDDSSVEYEVEKRPAAKRERARAGGAAGLGGSAAPLSKRKKARKPARK